MKRRIAIVDLETDPFEYGKVPAPFLSGVYDGEKFVTFWGDDCIQRLVDALAKWPEPLMIFAHNGGKFDYFYFLEHLEQSEMRIVNGRIIQARLGQHEIRDSYAIMPFALAQYQKDSIDYAKMHRSVRELHKDEILSYFRTDHTSLYELVTTFFDEFGDKLTVGSSSMTQLQKFHQFGRGKKSFDETFRPDFFFGGRNQCFKSGTIRRPLKIYDVNSMYPHVMKTCLHPIGTTPKLSTRIETDTCFIVVTGHNFGALPVRTETGGLDFTVPYGKFSTTIHEFNAALDTGTFKPVKIHKTYGFDERTTFAEFIDHFYNARNAAKKRGDKIRALLYKYVLNSAYGKFAQNPENYFEYCITPGDQVLDEQCPLCPEQINLECRWCQGSGFKWTPAAIHQNHKYVIWQHPLMQHFYYNITTGASITGAARAMLLRGIAAAVNPVYCDTDSIICEGMNTGKGSGIVLNEDDLGAWKTEGQGQLTAICGKKLYAVYDLLSKVKSCGCTKADEICTDCLAVGMACVKKAHKGTRLDGSEILRIAKGETIEKANPVPHFSLDGKHEFTKRKIKRTA